MSDFRSEIDRIANDSTRSKEVRTAAARCRNRYDQFHEKYKGDRARLERAEQTEADAHAALPTLKDDEALIAKLHDVEDHYFASCGP
jgi:uncharacterized protein YhaN